MSPFATKLLNFALYQLGWLSCIVGAAWDYPVIGALVALGLSGVHLLLADSRKAESALMGGSCLIGVVVDSIQQELGVFTFKMQPDWPFWLPLWVLVIWAQFATLFHYALAWLSGRYLLAAILGALGGPLAYWGGVRLGAAVFGENQGLSLMALAMTWALVMPALLWLSDQEPGGEGSYRWKGTQ
jgi:hypothetical protein